MTCAHAHLAIEDICRLEPELLRVLGRRRGGGHSGYEAGKRALKPLVGFDRAEGPEEVQTPAAWEVTLQRLAKATGV